MNLEIVEFYPLEIGYCRNFVKLCSSVAGGSIWIATY